MDIHSPQQIHTLEEEIFSLLEATGKRAVVMGRRPENDKPVAIAEDEVMASVAVPIFKVSNVTAEGLMELKQYLFHLPSHDKQWDVLKSQSLEIRVLEQYKVDIDEGDDADMDNEDDDANEQLITDKKEQWERAERGSVIVLGIVKSGSVNRFILVLFTVGYFHLSLFLMCLFCRFLLQMLCSMDRINAENSV